MKTSHFRTPLLAALLVCAAVLSFLPSAVNAQKKSKSAPAEAASAEPVIPSVQKAEDPDLEFITRLREEEFRHGQVMEIMSNLTDNIGPRLTGSPNMKKANEWTRDQLKEWGLVNANVEPWGSFGRGWAYQMAEVRMTAPDTMQFLALPQAWTPGTSGPVSGQPVLITATTPEELAKYKGQLAGKIVLVGEPRYPDPIEKAMFERYSDADLDKLSTYTIPNAPGGGPGGIPQNFRQQIRFGQALQRFLQEEKPAAVLQPSRQPGQDGTIFVQSGGSYQKDQPASVVPALTVALEHYNRVVRLLNKKVPVTLEVNVQAQFYDDDDKGYDTVAEIPGTDPKLKAQLVMLGGHMDSWHGGEGATDNAAGVTVAMEAVRLLQKLGVKPRRTIRIALWSGEEEGLLGSRGYVKNHFGGRKDLPPDQQNRDLPAFLRPQGALELKPEQKLVSGYFNYDNGTGKIRGIYLQENGLVAPIFRKWMEPLRDLGVTTIASGNTGGTDHLSFDAVGIPGFQFVQDEMDYSTLTHHSNLDVYEHIRANDLKQAAVVMATFVYQTAQRDEMLPRKPIRPDDPRPEQTNPIQR
jgi:carboxypeptidase Q